MKLSDYIERGFDLVQERHNVILRYEAGALCGCVFGGALVALLGEEEALAYNQDGGAIGNLLKERFPILDDPVIYPGEYEEDEWYMDGTMRLEGNTLQGSLWAVANCLHERELWSREEVLEFIREVEG